MSKLPVFTDKQLVQLKDCGVIDAQIPELRQALWLARQMFSKPAANNDVIALLDEVVKLSEKLVRTLGAISDEIDSAHAAAHQLIDRHFWHRGRLDDMAYRTVGNCLCPRLGDLASAANEGRREIPNQPARHRTGDGQSVRLIANALVRGWNVAHNAKVNASDSRASAVPPYPKQFKSGGRGSRFSEIVVICFEAIGHWTDATRAIRDFRKYEKANDPSP